MTETRTIENWEIFAAGSWNGSGGKSTWTIEDLDSMVSAFAETAKEMKPYLKLGHSEKQALLQQDGYPAAGWVTALKRVGDRLVATVSGIPSKIYNLIKAKAYGRVSSEIYKNAELNGKKFSRILKAVALLGADTPAVTTLQDQIDLYSKPEAVEQFGDNCEVEILFTQESETMEKMEITRAEYDVFATQKSELDSVTIERNTLKAENEKFSAEVKNLETMKGELAQFKLDAEQMKKDSFEKEVDFSIDGFLKDEKITPHEADYYKTISKRSKEDFELTQKHLELFTGKAAFAGERSESSDTPEPVENTEEARDTQIFSMANELVADAEKSGKVLDYGTAVVLAEQKLNEGDK